MIDKNKKCRVFISVAEPSADVHCANLINALRKSGYDNIELVGVGGPQMAQAGCKLLQTTVGKAAMSYNAFARLDYFYRLLRLIKRYLRSNDVDLVVVCDSPSFNWHVAKLAKKLHIKTLFYVAPQLWAWAAWRIGKLRRLCDKLCCLLPFEREWFGKRGIDCVFVGNPMLDAIRIEWGRPKQYADFDPAKVRIALMPGSRDAELKTLWQPMQKIALRIKDKRPGATFVTVAVDAKRQNALRESQIPRFECDYAVDAVCETADRVDFAIVASGSATLEVAAMGCPMVVMYQSSRLLWHLLGRWLVRAKYLALVNILCGKELVPEFMPYFSSIESIMAEIERLLSDRQRLAQISRGLVEAVEPLAAKKASEEVANIVLDMLRGIF